MHNYETANRNLDKARRNNKDVHTAETLQQDTCEKFERISKLAKQELNDFKSRRVAAFKKHFIDFVELQIKDAKVSGPAIIRRERSNNAVKPNRKQIEK